MVKPKTESTAVNELINLVAARGPSVPAPADELMFRSPEPAPMPRARAPLGTQPNPTMTMQGSRPSLPPPPVPPRASIQIKAAAPPPPVPSRAAIEVPPAPPPAEPDPLVALYANQAKGDADQAWVHDTRNAGRLQAPHGDSWVGTTEVSRHSTRRLLGKLVLAGILMAIAGGLLGAYLVLEGRAAAKAAAADTSTTAALPETIAVTSPDLATPQAGAQAFVDIRIDSTPAGATVMLIDRGKSMFLGTTPIKTAVDPTRTYDVVFELADRTQREHLDPRATSHLEISLGTDQKRDERKKVEKAKKVEQAKKIEQAVATAGTPARAAKAVAEPAGEGLLMIASKPPCELFIDGKATGLMTPQRGIPLSAGKHKVTLVSPDQKIKKTVTVDIVADKPTKVIQDLMGE